MEFAKSISTYRYRNRWLACLAAGVLQIIPQLSMATPEFAVSTGKFSFHGQAFSGLVADTSSISQNVLIAPPVATGGVQSNQPSINYLVDHSGELSFRFPIRSGYVDWNGALAVHSARYLLPEGIFPLIDPGVLDLRAIRGQVTGSKTISLYANDTWSVALKPHAGMGLNFVKTQYESAIIKLNDTSVIFEPFVGISALVLNEKLGLETSYRLYSGGGSEISLSLVVR